MSDDADKAFSEVEQRSRRALARALLFDEYAEQMRLLSKPLREQRSAWVKSLSSFEKHLKAKSGGQLVNGGQGRGKTRLCSSLMLMGADLFGYSSLYLSLQSLGQELSASMSGDKEARSAFDLLRLAKERELIVLDDVGAEKHDAAIKLVRQLLDVGADGRHYVVLVTNLDERALFDFLGADLRELSRRASFERVVFDKSVPDYRKGGA